MPSAPPSALTVKIYEYDQAKDVVVGSNPRRLTDTSIAYTARYPRRDKAAAARVLQITGRTPSIMHAPNGDIVATIFIPLPPPADEGEGGGGGGGLSRRRPAARSTPARR